MKKRTWSVSTGNESESGTLEKKRSQSVTLEGHINHSRKNRKKGDESGRKWESETEVWQSIRVIGREMSENRVPHDYMFVS